MTKMIPAGRLTVATPSTMAKAIRDGTEARDAVDERIEGVAIDIITDDVTIKASAAEAMADELAAKDVVRGDDPRLPAEPETLVRFQRLVESQYAVPFKSQNGKILGGIYADGTWEIAKLSLGDYDGATVSSRFDFAVAGDSTARGFQGGSDWPLADAWPAHLDGLLDRATVTNVGLSGGTVDEVGIYLGALPLVAQAQVVVPASGSVGVTVQAGIGWRPDRTWSFHGKLGTVAGTITRTTTATTALTFVPDAGQGGVTVPAGTAFVSDNAVHAWSTIILGAGRNNIEYNVKGTHGTIAEHVVAGILRIVDWLAPQRKRVLIWGTLNASNEPAGHARYAIMREINDTLRGLLPNWFVDYRAYLVSQAIRDLGITPTSADTTAMAGDAPPPSIMADSIHPAKSVSPVAAAFWNTALVRRDWKA